MQELLIESIRTDNGVQSRVKIDEAYVAELAEIVKAGGKLPPIDVYHDGTEYWAADGFHRIMAHVRVGKRNIKANIHKGTHDDSVWASCAANLTHGLRRTNEDKRHAVSMALSLHPDRSDRAIAEHVGVGADLVGSVRRQVSLNDNSNVRKPIDSRVGRDGKKYHPPPPPAPAKSAPKLPPPAAFMVDSVGKVIPDHLKELFLREREVTAVLSSISEIIGSLKRAQESADPLYGDVNFQGATAGLRNAYDAIKATTPYAVCPWCRGLTMDSCNGCGKRGVLGKYRWENTVPQELRN